MDDKEVLTLLKNKYKNGIVPISKISDNNIISYLINRFSDSLSLKESYWRILYKIYERPVCKICGNPVEFIGRKNIIFKSTCCKECESKLKSLLNKNKVLSNETLEKIKITKLNKYNDKNYNNRTKAKQTCLERYGVESYSNTTEYKEKTKQTCLEKYGVDHVSKLNTNSFKTNNPQKIKDIKEKTKQTNILKYGGNSPMSSKEVSNKQRKAVIDKYSNNWWWTDEEYKKMMSKITSSKETQEKLKNTCIELYGEISFSKTNQFKQIIKDKHDIIQEKIYKTKKLNNSFNTSKLEELSYILLYEKYPDVIRQYKSDVYPFFCDFYIPSLDLYIEIQGSHFHNKHPYIGNEEDIKELNIFIEKSKEHPQYINIIKTWTERDVIKRNTAKENNLNYLEIWNINELKDFLNIT